MSHKCDLTASEKSVITSELTKDKLTVEISKIIGKYHQTMTKFVAAPKRYVKKLIGVTQGLFSNVLCNVFEAVNNLGLTSEGLFRHIQGTNVSRSIWCHLQKKVRISVRLVMPPLTKIHIWKYLKWAKDIMKKSRLWILPMIALTEQEMGYKQMRSSSCETQSKRRYNDLGWYWKYHGWSVESVWWY